jgi:hypothetical protein
VANGGFVGAGGASVAVPLSRRRVPMNMSPHTRVTPFAELWIAVGGQLQPG